MLRSHSWLTAIESFLDENLKSVEGNGRIIRAGYYCYCCSYNVTLEGANYSRMEH